MNPIVPGAIGMTRQPLEMAVAEPPKPALAPVGTEQTAPAAPTGSPEVTKAAREFEAIFLRTLLGSLEKTTQLGAKGALSGGQSAYGSMVVSAMADSLSSVGGIGLADVIARALTSHSTPPPTDKPK
ncbi:MAG TPA: hypothetical protein VIM73_00455 [Polyangiaceae bacterium]